MTGNEEETPLRMQGVSRGLEGGNKPLSLIYRQEALHTQRLSQKEVQNARFFSTTM